MSSFFTPKVLLGLILILCCGLYFYKGSAKKEAIPISVVEPVQTVIAVIEEKEIPRQELVLPADTPVETTLVIKENPKPIPSLSSDSELPKEVNRMALLFQPYPPQLPIVETLSFSSKVPWVTGRPAYLGDYAAYFETSKHFISRSLKGEGNYQCDTVSKGDRFNVLRKDKEIEFHLVLDLSRLKIWTYYYDVNDNSRVLLKSYPVSVGKLDPSSSSGSLTPTGVYKLGREIAVYKPGVMGLWRGETHELVTIFGMRWIPFDREIANCTGPCKGLGIHGVPWEVGQDGRYTERTDQILTYNSEGCVRMLDADIKELFAVIVSRSTYIHVVQDFQQAQLPGQEKYI